MKGIIVVDDENYTQMSICQNKKILKIYIINFYLYLEYDFYI